MKRAGLLPELLQSYFQHWLANQRNVSHHPIISYRDSWRLFLRFVAQQLQRDVARLDTSELTAERVIAFLDDAERVAVFSLVLCKPRDLGQPEISLFMWRNLLVHRAPRNPDPTNST